MPHFFYNNALNSSGIYTIYNNFNGRIYGGSTNNFKRRLETDHYKSLLKNKHHNKFLQADFNKCKQELGHDNFLEFHILENMPGSTREQRLKRENFWLSMHHDDHKNCYNLSKFANSAISFSKNPEETRKKHKKYAKQRCDNNPEVMKNVHEKQKIFFRENPDLKRQICALGGSKTFKTIFLVSPKNKLIEILLLRSVLL